MSKYNRVVQMGFDIAVGEGVSEVDLESLASAIEGVIDSFYDENGQAVKLSCIGRGKHDMHMVRKNKQITRMKSLPTNMGDLNYERNGTRKKTKP